MKHSKKKSKHVKAPSVAPVSQHFDFLDGFRGIAIVTILAHHMRHALALDDMFSHPTPIFTWIYFKLLEYFTWNVIPFYESLQQMIHQLKGLLGLQMFFVLSGFLITRMLLKGGLEKIHAVRFYVRRFFKIYPSYAFLVIVSLLIFNFLVFHSLDESFWPSLGQYLVFLQNYVARNQLLEHTWSLVVMEQFYFFCPLVIMTVIRYFKTVEERRAALIGLCALLLIAGQAIRLYCLANSDALIDWPVKAPRFWRTTLFHMDSLAFGCLLALLEPYFARLKEIKWAGWSLWMLGVGLFIYLMFILDWSYYWGPWYAYPLGYVSAGCVVVAAFCGVSFFSRLKVLQKIGIYSYGIYLWHYIVMSYWGSWAGKISVSVLMVTCFVSSILLGVVTTKIVEQYFLGLREKIFPRLN